MNQQIGPFQIERELGRGGMGEVFLARDTRLDRQVAIKTLPAHLSEDGDRLARFQREAKVLASLNHPGIGAIYGLEESGGHQYLILEFIEGETLAERLKEGALPVDEALRVAKQIAEALEAAHEKGVVHRDLKPGNVMVTPEGVVKVLDFGLARSAEGTPSSTNLPRAPKSMSVTSPLPLHSPTIPGAIMGTAGYMSPEQARGKPVDKRSDIFSFGCILFEMLTGLMPFRGETVTDALGATLHKEADLALLPAQTPPTIRLLLTRCLAKDRANRLHDIADARVELAQAIADPNAWAVHAGADRARTPGALLRRAAPWAVCAALAAALGVVWFTARPAQPNVMRLTMPIPESQALRVGTPGSAMDISPDGTRVVFVGRNEAGRQLYLRNLDQVQATPLANTDEAISPFFSPDGQWIAFAQRGKLRKVSILGGPAAVICDAQEMRGGTWGADGTIAFSPSPRSGIWRVPAAGGEPVKVTDIGDGELFPSHRWPHFLPDGKTVLYTSTENNNDFSAATIHAVSLDTGQEKVLFKGGTHARFISSGHIVFGRGGTLMAVPFDAGKLEVTGSAVPVLEGVLSNRGYGSLQFACSRSGVLLYAPGEATDDDRMLVWIDSAGTETPASSRKRGYNSVSLSPDGTRLAAEIFTSGNIDIWIVELDRDSFSRLTFNEENDQNPRWSPDGRSIIFSSNTGGSALNLFRQSADGTGEAQRLTSSVNAQAPYGLTPDGSILLYGERTPKDLWNILYLRVIDPEAKPEVFLSTPFDEGAAALSPDGKWVAYHSNESGDYEVYVRPFMRPGGRTKVSAGGRAGFPRWSPDGKELYYRTPQDALIAASLTQQEDGLRFGTPRQLFEFRSSSYAGPLGVTPDGARFLFNRPANVDSAALSQQPMVIVNWLAEVEAKMRPIK